MGARLNFVQPSTVLVSLHFCISGWLFDVSVVPLFDDLSIYFASGIDC